MRGIATPTERCSASGLEGVVGFAVVGEVAEVVHGIFEERGGGEDRQADGGAGEGAGDGEGEASSKKCGVKAAT